MFCSLHQAGHAHILFYYCIMIFIATVVVIVVQDIFDFSPNMLIICELIHCTFIVKITVGLLEDCNKLTYDMGSEIEGGVFDIHFGNKNDVDLFRIILVETNTSNPSWVYHFCNLWLKKRPDCSNHVKKSDWRNFTIFKMVTEYFPVLLAPSDSMLPLEGI
jgi:hypothetical protein